MQTTRELHDLIQLERQGEHHFVGYSRFMGSPNVFGGQVVAQALHAATQTVPEDRLCHSLHAYFVLPGKLDLPITYQVQKIRDGGSFTTRYVVTSQEDTPIFVMAASFQKQESGYVHQITMPDVAPPEILADWIEIGEQHAGYSSGRMSDWLRLDRPIEFRPCVIDTPPDPVTSPDYRVWFRFREAPSKLQPAAVQQLLAYASDYNILTSALRMHSETATLTNTQLASLDHAIWFHQDTNLDDWLLFSLSSPSSSGARGFASGHIFNRSGKLIATVSQEGLIRPIR